MAQANHGDHPRGNDLPGGIGAPLEIASACATGTVTAATTETDVHRHPLPPVIATFPGDRHGGHDRVALTGIGHWSARESPRDGDQWSEAAAALEVPACGTPETATRCGGAPHGAGHPDTCRPVVAVMTEAGYWTVTADGPRLEEMDPLFGI